MTDTLKGGNTRGPRQTTGIDGRAVKPPVWMSCIAFVSSTGSAHHCRWDKAPLRITGFSMRQARLSSLTTWTISRQGLRNVRKSGDSMRAVLIHALFSDRRSPDMDAGHRF